LSFIEGTSPNGKKFSRIITRFVFDFKHALIDFAGRNRSVEREKDKF